MDHSSGPPFPQRPHFHGVRGESAPKGMMGTEKGTKAEDEKDGAALAPWGLFVDF